jgi:hypothetical protein
MKLVLGPLVLGLVVTLGGAGKVAADPDSRIDTGFRCPGGRLVSTGDAMYEVRRRCGDPDAVIQRTEKRKIKVKVRRGNPAAEQEELTEEREIEVLVDEWTYDFGADRFIRYVAFENARVVGVTTGGYGSRL